MNASEGFLEKIEHIQLVVSEMEGLKKSDRKRICANFYLENRDHFTKSSMIENFLSFGVAKRTAQRYMSLFDAGEGFECKPIPGRPKIELDRNQRQKLDRMINNKVFCGYRAVG